MEIKELKRKVKIFLIWLGTCVLKKFSNIYFKVEVKPTDNRKHYVIFYVSSYGSLGDGAMGYSIISQIEEHNPNSKITVFLHKDEDIKHFEHYGVELISIEGYFSILPKLAVTRKMSSVIATASDYIIPGADVLDGVYSPGAAYRRLLSGAIALKSGVNVNIVGFSFSHRADKRIKAFFKNHLQGCNIVCRDPHSAERLTEVMGRQVPYGADLAFLLPIGEHCIHPTATKAESQILSWKQSNLPICVFNANPLSFANALPNVSRNTVVEVMAESLDIFVKNTSSAILFLTHDNRIAYSDAVFVEQIISKMKMKGAYYFVPETIEPTDIKRLCTYSELIVTGRMHLGIAGLGTGTTTMITDYQGKVTGLYDLFGCKQLALDLSEIIKPGRLASLMLDAFENRSEFESTIKAELPKVKELSRRNLANVFS